MKIAVSEQEQFQLVYEAKIVAFIHKIYCT